MKKRDIKNSFDSINPDNGQIEKMFMVISDRTSKSQGFSFFNENFYKRAIPAMAMIIMIGCISIIYLAMRNIPSDTPGVLTSQSGDDIVTMCNGYNLSDEDRILINNKIYVRMTPEEINYYNLSDLQIPEEKGEKIATISDKSNEYFNNCDVYGFGTDQDTDIVAVETSDGFILFIFEQYTE